MQLDNNKSKSFIIGFIITANCTTKSFLLAVATMITSYWALFWTWTLRQLLFWILAYVVTITLPFMTWFTKMSVTPTKPLSSRTTIFALKLYEIFSMFWAIFNWNFTAIWTYQLLGLKWSCILRLVHGLCAVFPATKIWIFTFKTLKISVNGHGILIGFVKIRRLRIF